MVSSLFPNYSVMSDSTGDSSLINAVINKPKSSKVLEYALPAAAIAEAILTQGKSPGTAALASLQNIETGKEKYTKLLDKQEKAKQAALERKLKETELGYKQTAEERAAAEEGRKVTEAGRETEKYTQEKEAQEKFGAMYRQLNPDAESDLEYYKKNRGEYFKNKAAELPPITGAVIAGVSDPVLKQLATQGVTSPAARKQFWTEFSSRYEAQQRAKETTEEKRSKAEVDYLNQMDTRIEKNLMAKYRPIVNAVASARGNLEMRNPIGDAAVGTAMARMSGEVGVLTDTDVARFTGSRDISQKLQNALKIAATGKMTEGNRAYMLGLIGVYEKAANMKLSENLLREENRQAAMGKDISTIIDAKWPEGISREEVAEKMETGKPKPAVTVPVTGVSDKDALDQLFPRK